MNDAIRVKNESKKKWESLGRQDGRDSYLQANKEATKEVARSKTRIMDEVYKEFEIPEGEIHFYRIPEVRDKSKKGVVLL